MTSKRYKHGLAVMRCQPFHIGHKRIIDRMLKECELITIVIGSIQEKDTELNPFNFPDRKEMVMQVYAHKGIFVTGLPDLGDPPNWGAFVLDHVNELCNTPVDVYYAGTKADLSCFTKKDVEIIEIPRNNESFPYVSGTMIRNMCETQDIRWMLYVPEQSHEIVKKLFEKYRFKNIGRLSEARSHVSGR